MSDSSTNLIKILNDIPREYWPNKVTIENDIQVLKFIEILFSDDSWRLYLDFIKKNVEKGFFYANRNIELNSFQSMIKELFEKGSFMFLRFITGYVTQFKEYQDNLDIVNKLHLFIKQLKSENILQNEYEGLLYCSTCNVYQIVSSDEIMKKSNHECGSELLKVIKAQLTDNIITCIKNGQFLELYIKSVLKSVSNEKHEFNPIIYTENQQEISTSITYKIDSSNVEIDVAGVLRNNHLFIFEAKDKKVSQNTLDTKLPKLNRLVRYIKRKYSSNFKTTLWIVSTNEINLERSEKEITDEYDWWDYLELIDGNKLLSLKDAILKYIK